MAICPFAVQKLIPANFKQPRIKPRAIIAHSAGGKGSLYGWWLNPQSKGLECHFWIGDKGEIEQYVDTEVRADANGAANSFAVSIETSSTKHATERWNAAQAASLVRLIDWICKTHSIPRTLMQSATGSGLAWHIQFGSPGPWTPSVKVCPGPARIQQYKNEIVPAIQRMAQTPNPPKETFLMALSDAEQKDLLKKINAIEQKANATAFVVTILFNILTANKDAPSNILKTMNDTLTKVEKAKKG